MEQARPFPIVYNVGDMVEGWRKARALAESAAHVIPGHDPMVLERYPAAGQGLEGVIARLD
jgi:glyoxylase-like metal-dependent hydrolase (beta-lactamase superfamily II)